MADLTQTLDAVVRRERGRIVGGLLRLCRDLDAAEEAFQEAVLSALQAWKHEPPPAPGAWLMAAAKNAARDAHRHRAVVAAHAPLLAEDEMDASETVDTVTDDTLRLMFACCHPALSTDNRIALTLKTVAGFSTEDIARAFRTSEATVSQRILRAKQTLTEKQATYAIPEPAELGARLDAVLGVVYAMFNEGHVARSGPLMKLELQAEALRLGRLLCDLAPTAPEAFGLCALMAFSAARARTRVDADGLPILLADQNRALWNREGLREALMALARARTLGGGGPYVVQAEIAAVHATAPTWKDTDWNAIVALYDSLPPSPVVALNRAIALSLRDGAEAGLAALAPLAEPLRDDHLFYAARAQMLATLGRDPRPDLEAARARTTNDAERRLLEKRLSTL